MSHGLRTLLALAGVMAVGATGCYHDALTPLASAAPVVVRLTDGSPGVPGERMQVYVTEIAASTTADTLPAAQRWYAIAAPRRRFDLSGVGGDASLGVGAGRLPEGDYRGVRVTIDTDSTRVSVADGRAARVRWPVTGAYAMYAVVERPLQAAPGAPLDLVLQLDVDRTLLPNLDPLFDFVSLPVLRAVDGRLTGRLLGTVRGGGGPLAGAVVTVLRPDSSVIAAAGSDGTGGYQVGFLLAGSYAVRVTGPGDAAWQPVTLADVQIGAGADSRLDVTLMTPPAARRGSGEPVIPPWRF